MTDFKFTDSDVDDDAIKRMGARRKSLSSDFRYFRRDVIPGLSKVRETRLEVAAILEANTICR